MSYEREWSWGDVWVLALMTAVCVLDWLLPPWNTKRETYE